MRTDRTHQDADTIRRVRSAVDALVAGSDRVADADSAVNLSDRQARSTSRPAAVAMLRVGVGVVVVLVGSIAVWNSRSESDRVGTSDQSTTVVSTVPTSPEFDLQLADAEFLRQDELTARDTPAAAWEAIDGSAFLTVVVREGLGSVARPEKGAVAESFPSDEGSAWFEPTSSGDHPRARLWWSRTDGDLWILSGHWAPNDLRPQGELESEMQEWALAIETTPSSDEPSLSLPDARWRSLSSQSGGDIQSQSWVWRVEDQEVLLVALEDAAATGIGNLLNVAGWPEPYAIGETSGWIVRGTGHTAVSWMVEDSAGTPYWVTLSIPGPLTARAEEIAQAIVRTS